MDTGNVPEEEGTINALGSSAMDAIRQKHQEITDQTTIDIPLPGYGDLLVARYRMLDVTKELVNIGRNLAKEFDTLGEQALYGSIDVMVVACMGLYTKKGGELVSIAEYEGPNEPPIRYDYRLAEFMGWPDITADSGTARDVVLRVFGNKEPVIVEHASQLQRWFRTSDRRVNADFLDSMM